ncbi:MAG: hypothetical protein A2Y76_06800 [Planctomycetes bacterium RBG_13_60_9]|nr:MAG: hypothetical protein A2Y76_06800 [Planctomycetes bacterium RBG_13_60_9]
MRTSVLGRTKLQVSELCFGALCMGPCQKKMDLESSAELVSAALRGGVNFIDTAQVYGTYAPIRLAVKRTGIRPVIASKSLATGFTSMCKDVLFALYALRVIPIDIFLLHGARACENVFEERKGAWRCLRMLKAIGLIRAIGISTHSVKVTQLAATRDDVDIVFPLINLRGMGILHGTREDMEKAVRSCVKNGKGVYLMKALAGGSLISRYVEAMNFARGIPGVQAIAVGMVSVDELRYNLDFFSGVSVAPPSIANTTPKAFFVSRGLCVGCGACAERCPNGAINMTGAYANIDASKCLTCGYCVEVCKQFAIRMV